VVSKVVPCIRYPVTETLSVAAVQDKFVDVEVVPDAVKLAGVDGVVVSAVPA
jgi:hypothetical protein